MIRGHDAIRDAYRDAKVARTYVDQRFREPLGALLHTRQVGAVRRVARSLRPRRVVEIAPGPGRLTVDLTDVLREGLLVDASPEMLAVARRNLAERHSTGWRMAVGDAFALPLADAAADLVYSFRFVRHFELADRTRVYGEIRRILGPHGLFVFDVVNAAVSAPIRAKDPDRYLHYDALLRFDELRDELRASGLRIVATEGVQHRYQLLRRLQILVAPRSRRVARIAMELVDRLPGGAPLEWIVTCRRE